MEIVTGWPMQKIRKEKKQNNMAGRPLGGEGEAPFSPSFNESVQ